MARDYISISRSVNPATHSQLLLSFVSNVRGAYDAGTKILAIMNHMHDGANFTDIETIFGVPAGKGQTVFDLVNGTVGSMNGQFQVADAKTLTEIVG